MDGGVGGRKMFALPWQPEMIFQGSRSKKVTKLSCFWGMRGLWLIFVCESTAGGEIKGSSLLSWVCTRRKQKRFLVQGRHNLSLQPHNSNHGQSSASQPGLIHNISGFGPHNASISSAGVKERQEVGALLTNDYTRNQVWNVDHFMIDHNLHPPPPPLETYRLVLSLAILRHDLRNWLRHNTKCCI